MGWRAFYPASMFDTYAATAKRTTRSRMYMTFESVCGWSNTCRVDVQRLRWKPRDRHALENVLCTRQPPHSQGLGRYGQRLACPEVRLPAVVWRGTLTRAGRREAQEEVALLEREGEGGRSAASIDSSSPAARAPHSSVPSRYTGSIVISSDESADSSSSLGRTSTCAHGAWRPRAPAGSRRRSR